MPLCECERKLLDAAMIVYERQSMGQLFNRLDIFDEYLDTLTPFKIGDRIKITGEARGWENDQYLRKGATGKINSIELDRHAEQLGWFAAVVIDGDAEKHRAFGGVSCDLLKKIN